MKSNRRAIEKRFLSSEKRKLLATGLVSANGVKADITRQGLVESSRMLNDVRPSLGEHSVSFGTTLDNPNYPKLLNNGFVHVADAEEDDPHEGGEPQSPTVGPYHFMENGQAATEDDVRRIWERPIR